MDQSIKKQIKKNILRQSIAEITDDEQVNWQDVKTKVSQGDITYTIAVTIAQRKIEEFEKTTGNEKGLKYLPLYNSTQTISYILITIYLSLSLFQKPAWCLAKPIYNPEQNSYYDDCSGTTLEGSVIIVSTLPYLQTWQLISIEVFCMTLLTSRKMLRRYIKQSKSLYFKILIFLTVLLYVCEVLQYSVGITFPFNQFIRPIYVLTYAKMIRKNIALYMRIVWKSKEIFVIIAGIFFIYVALGRVFFYQTAQNAPGSSNFDTFSDTMYNLFVSLSTSNYPDNMMPIYEKHRLASLYWLFFLAFVNMALLRIIIAYFYLYYKEELSAQAKKFEVSLSNVFNDPEFSNSQDSFRQSQIQGRSSMEMTLDQMELLHEEDAGRIFGHSRWKRKLLTTLNIFAVKTFFALASLAAFLAAVIQSNLVSPEFGVPITPDQAVYNQSFNQSWLIGEFVLNYVLFMDPFLRIICLGWRYIIKSKFLIFEFILSIVILCLLAMSLFGDSTLSLTPVKILMILRFCRFLKWINCFEKYNLIFSTLFKLIPLFLNLLGVLGIVFYFYVTAGEVMFGGYVKTNSPINFNQYGDPEYYVYENFNDFYMGLCACYHLIIVNNWLYTVDVHCKVMGDYRYRLFFVSFYIVAVMICFNILMAFILDIFVTQISNKNARPKAVTKSDPIYESPKTFLRRFAPGNKNAQKSFALSEKSFGPETTELNDDLNSSNLRERLLKD